MQTNEKIPIPVLKKKDKLLFEIIFVNDGSTDKSKNKVLEFIKKVKYPVIDIMKSQKKVFLKGATMRLGSYSCTVSTRTNAYKAYQKKMIYERHRHRYEVNNKYINKLVANGLTVSGKNEKLNLVEMIEIKDHPWFVGVQFHPELKSRIVKAHPLFRDFISAAMKYNESK